MGKKLVIAFGTCQTCNQFVQQVGSTAEDAKMLLRHGHGGKKHLWQGPLETRPCDNEEARKIERAAA